MKKSFANAMFLSTLLIGMCLFSSCDDDDDENNDGNALVGSWTAVSFSTSNCTDPEDDGEFFVEDSIVITFNSDGTYTSLDEDGESEGTYSVSGNTLTVDGDASIFTLNGNSLTISEENPASGCTDIITLSKV